ncbi:S-adenosyl-L-methionine-dependent methyltransferase [Piromyces finnis]|uniref:S-adenosyl-L-methionine-dependent methyltransferase n=1 Tax=Piromyces finnis TaxID=1754191 RepID=A0A1Y1VCN6_9FUNG|nr:S-adenosyl-L-methionine-dependent methyltransferase [Piromyces finnis]|eukprot:ORX52878.1 S-adenosyl-L-methionine-dependent methyltransferase [Piromyces finnis]
MEETNKRILDNSSPEVENNDAKKVKIDVESSVENSSNNEVSMTNVEESSSVEASNTEVTEASNTVETTIEETDNNEEDKEQQTEFKIKIEKLPQYINIPDLRKIFQKYELRFWKCKTNLKWDFAFASFKSEEERQDAINKLNGLKIKTSNIVVIPINDNKDKEKKFEKRPSNISRKGNVKEPEPEDTRTPNEKLMDQVTPFWRFEYKKQIFKKARINKKVLSAMVRTFNQKGRYMEDKQKSQLGWVKEASDANRGLICPLDEVVKSPVLTHYRNKCEFTIGHDFEGQRTIGFLLGLFREGVTVVLGIDECVHVPEKAKAVVKHFQEYIRKSDLDAFSRKGHKGFWRLLTTRFYKTGEDMIIIQVHPQDLSRERIEQEKKNLVTFFTDLMEKIPDLHISSLLFQESDEVSNGATEKAEMEVLMGSKYAHENLLGINFRISPNAFFQVNTDATELLYTTIRDWCIDSVGKDKKIVLLDLCCGTGTIGICMAQYFKRIVGIELCEQAVVDARYNAETNNIKNVEYICAKIEDAMKGVFNKIGRDEEVVAVLDPPRTGVHGSVIQAIRECAGLKHLIYVSCDANAAIQNFIDLCRPTSNRYKNNFFKPVRARPFDLFPQTRHCELVIDFKRD